MAQIDFFQARCQQGPLTAALFGLCDDQNSTPAYADTTTPQKWIAQVHNRGQRAVVFTAIDKCVMADQQEPGRGRCDGMLTADNLLYLVELKDRKTDSTWKTDAIAQLVSTIEFLQTHHDLSPFRHKKAYVSNKKKPCFVTIEHEQRVRFFRTHGFRLDIHTQIVIDA